MAALSRPAKQASGQGRAERQHGSDLAGLRDHISLGAEHVDGQVDGHARNEQLSDQIAVPQEAPRRQPRPPCRQEYANHVQHREDSTGRQAEPEEVGAAQEQQPLGGDAQVADQGRAALGELRGRRRHVKPAMGVDDVQRQHGRRRSCEGGSAESHVVPLRRQWLPLDGHGLADADRAYSRERQHPDVEHQHVRHHGPAKERPGDDRDIPARAAGMVQDQPDHHHRHGRADVVR